MIGVFYECCLFVADLAAHDDAVDTGFSKGP